MRARAERWLCRLGALAVLGCDRAEPALRAGSSLDENVGRSGSVAKAQPGAARPAHAGATAAAAQKDRSASADAPASGARTEGARCRVMSVSGEASGAGTPLRAGATLEQQLAIELGHASTLHLVHTASARQWTFSGPARLFACDRGAEEIVLALGALRTEPGSGVRPGAEVWVGTPYGSLRYSDARAEIRVTADTLVVQVSVGSVWFSPLTGDAAAEQELASGTSTFSTQPYRLTIAAATQRCERAASAADARASELLAPSAESLGARAREHVRARQLAHASCSSALAALLAGEEDAAHAEPSRAGYSALARFDRLWRGVPELPAAPTP